MICDYYINPYVTHEELSYDVDTLKKINQLRFDSFLGSKDRIVTEDFKYQQLKNLVIGSYIYFRPQYNKPRPKLYYKESYQYKGEITKVYKSKWKGYFDIRIGSEHFRKVDYKSLYTREIKSYATVNVPKKVKQMSTEELLHELRFNYSYYEYDCGDYREFDRETIKAELSTREHVTTNKKQLKILEDKLAEYYARWEALGG